MQRQRGATAKVFCGPFYFIGDKGAVDEDGYFCLRAAPTSSHPVSIRSRRLRLKARWLGTGQWIWDFNRRPRSRPRSDGILATVLHRCERDIKVRYPSVSCDAELTHRAFPVVAPLVTRRVAAVPPRPERFHLRHGRRNLAVSVVTRGTRRRSPCSPSAPPDGALSTTQGRRRAGAALERPRRGGCRRNAACWS